MHYIRTFGKVMHLNNLARRYSLLQAEIKMHMSTSEKWRHMPALLDQLNMLRNQYLAAKRSFELLSEESEKLACRKALH